MEPGVCAGSATGAGRSKTGKPDSRQQALCLLVLFSEAFSALKGPQHVASGNARRALSLEL